MCCSHCRWLCCWHVVDCVVVIVDDCVVVIVDGYVVGMLMITWYVVVDVAAAFVVVIVANDVNLTLNGDLCVIVDR